MSITAPSQRTLIDTGKVTGRRSLRFTCVDDALAEIDQLAAAERAGKLTALGNWTLGQTIGHLATWTEFSFTGPPLKAPFIIRMILRLRKNKYLRKGMPAGVKIPRVPGGTLGIDVLPLEETLERYRRALERLARECPIKPNVIFGPLTHQEWIALNLRHAELHLSFFEAQ